MATLQKIGDKAQCPVNTGKMRIGRASDNEIIIDDDAVSSHHAVITAQSSSVDSSTKEYVIEDLESTNKTYVNNNVISRHSLSDGDIIRIGRTRLKFSTQQFIAPKADFEKTQALSSNRLTNFLFLK